MSDGTIILMPASEYRREHYGLMFESVLEYDVRGKGVHNRHHPHKVQMWENRPNRDGVVVTPSGTPTDELHTFVLDAQSVVISSTPSALPPALLHGDDLAIGDVVTLVAVDDSVADDWKVQALGRFAIESRFLADPILIPLDDKGEEG